MKNTINYGVREDELLASIVSEEMCLLDLEQVISDIHSFPKSIPAGKYQ